MSERLSAMDSARIEAVERRMQALPLAEIPPEEKLHRAHVLTAQYEMLLDEFLVRYQIRPECGDRVDRQEDGTHLIRRGS